MAITPKTSKQRVMGLVAFPFCVAFLLWLIWPIISFISFLTEALSHNFDSIVEALTPFDYSIFWKMYLCAYLIGFLLLLAIKCLAGGRVSLLYATTLEGLAITVFGYPVYAVKEMIDFFTTETEVAESLGALLQALIKGGAVYFVVAFGLWFEDVPVLLMCGGIVVMIWLLDRISFWKRESENRADVILNCLSYYAVILIAIAIAVLGCVAEFGRLGKDLADLASQLLPICLAFTLLTYYTLGLAGKGGSHILHLVPLVLGFGVSFLGAYLLTVSKVLFFVLLVALIAWPTRVLIPTTKKLFNYDPVKAAEKRKKLMAKVDALYGKPNYGTAGSTGSSGGTNPPVNKNLPEDKGCEKLRKRLNGMTFKTGSSTSFGFTVSYKATLSVCREGTVVWNVALSHSPFSSTPISKEQEEKHIRFCKSEFERWIRDDTYRTLQDLALYYKTYGGAWSVTVRI